MGKLTIGEIKRYLNAHDDNEILSIVVIDPQKRIHHINQRAVFISDAPAIFVETVEAEPMEPEGD